MISAKSYSFSLCLKVKCAISKLRDMKSFLQFLIVVAYHQAVINKNLRKNMIVRYFLSPFAKHSGRSKHAERITLEYTNGSLKTIFTNGPI